MIETADAALQEIEKRSYPVIFRQLYEGQIPLELVGSCAPPKRYFQFASDLRSVVPESENWLPLWESNLEAIVALDTENNTYVRHYYGSGEVETLGNTYQQFLSAFFLELVDSGIWDELDDVAALFGYKYTSELREFVDSCDDSDFEESNRKFVNSIAE